MRFGSLGAMVVLSLGASACSRCNSDASPAPAVEAGRPDSGSTSTSAPYLPARSAADDSYAPTSQVESVLFSLRPGLNLCYRVAAQSNRNLVAKTIFAVSIGANGHVTGVELVSSETPLTPDFVECIKGVLVQADFKPTPNGQPATVKVPIAFRPPSEGFRPDAGVIGAGWRDAGK